MQGAPNRKIREHALTDRCDVEADHRADGLVALVDETRRAAATTLQSIADVLNTRGISAARGGQRDPTTVSTR